ncbi:hypothetical protein Tco_0431231 [Tanacetum coccineum]
MENEKNKRLMESVGAADYLSSIITNMTSSSQAGEVNAADAALTILYITSFHKRSLNHIRKSNKISLETMTACEQSHTRVSGHLSGVVRDIGEIIRLRVMLWGAYNREWGLDVRGRFGKEVSGRVGLDGVRWMSDRSTGCNVYVDILFMCDIDVGVFTSGDSDHVSSVREVWGWDLSYCLSVGSGVLRMDDRLVHGRIDSG